MATNLIIGIEKWGGPLVKKAVRAHLFNPLTRISPPCVTRGPQTKKFDFGSNGVNVLVFFLFHFGVENYKGHWSYNFLKTPFWSSFGDENTYMIFFM